jgi:hypothetical protein
MNQTGRGAGNAPPETEAEQSDENRTATRAEVTFSEAGGATVAAILHPLRLVSAELMRRPAQALATCGASRRGRSAH